MTEALGDTVTYEIEVGRGRKFIVRLPYPKKEIEGEWTEKQTWFCLDIYTSIIRTLLLAACSELKR
jgi:hypothetical protein